MVRKKWLFYCMLFATTMVLVAAVVAGTSDRRARDVIGYNVLKERMFKGVVASEGVIIEGLMHFQLKVTNAIVEVQIGPKEFVERCGFKINTGDTVTVIGMLVVVNARHVVLAREVRGKNGVLIVRDQVGLPLWEKDRPILMDPERRSRSDQECALIR